MFTLVFLVGTWAFCRAGFQVGFKAQAIATLALVVGLAGLAVFSIFQAGQRGELAARMLTSAPSVPAFVAAIGTGIFLFMGFELVTSQAEHATSKAISRGLKGKGREPGLEALRAWVVAAKARAVALPARPE